MANEFAVGGVLPLLYSSGDSIQHALNVLTEQKLFPTVFASWFCMFSFLPRRSQDVFKSVERLCEAEGIDCAKFMYRDNTTILETLEGGRCDTF